MEAAQTKAEAAKQILDAKEIKYKDISSKVDNVMSDARKKSEKAKKGIENASKEVQKAEKLVKSLLEKIESESEAKL